MSGLLVGRESIYGPLRDATRMIDVSHLASGFQISGPIPGEIGW